MKPVIILLMGMLSTAHVMADDSIAQGQRLFSESRCLECHGTNVFTRADRQVKNLRQLEQRVRTCDANLNINWFDDEIMQVVQYLNASFYKFPDAQQSENNHPNNIVKEPPATIASHSSNTQ